MLVAFIQYAQSFFRPIQDLSEKYNILQSAMAASERVFKLLDTQVEIVSPRGHESAAGAGADRVRPCWFAYNVSGDAGPVVAEAAPRWHVAKYRHHTRTRFLTNGRA